MNAEGDYDPRFGPNDKVKDEYGAEMVIEAVMISATDGGVYYRCYNVTGVGTMLRKAEKVDRNYALDERADERE